MSERTRDVIPLVVEQSVRERYSEGAQRKEPALWRGIRQNPKTLPVGRQA